MQTRRTPLRGGSTRRGSILVLLTLLLSASVLAVSPVSAGAVEAAAVDTTLVMPAGGGSLLMQGSEDATPLDQPTSLELSVDESSGAIAGGTFSTPTISFMQHVTSPLEADVFIDASFSQVEPQGATGSVDHLGNVSVRSQFIVDLHVEVGDPAFLTADCEASPVSLNLRSEEPYDPDTGTVTLADTDFSVPAVEESSTCSNIVAPAINEQLAGGGHSLTVAFEGDLPVPAAPGDATSTELSVSPESSARAGAPVTLEATVEPEEGPAANGVSGEVEFFDGSVLLGREAVEDGIGRLEIDTLAVGSHTLSAQFLGGGGFGGSVSSVVDYQIDAVPLVQTGWPSFLTVGEDPIEFDVQVMNPSQGSAVSNARVDIEFEESPGARLDDLELEYRDDDDQWVPLPLERFGSKTVEVGEHTGFPLASDENHTIGLRVAAVSGLGSFAITTKVLDVDPSTGDVRSELSEAHDVTGYGPPDRQPVEIRDDPRSPAVQPTTVRPGFTPYVHVKVVAGAGGSGSPTGRVHYLLDGRPIQASDGAALAEHQSEWTDDVPAGRGVQVRLPMELSTGQHTLTAVYSGDANFLPATESFSITVENPMGVPFACEQETVSGYRPTFDVLVSAQGVVPRYGLAGDSVDIERLRIELRSANDQGSSSFFSSALQEGQNDVGEGGFNGVDLGFDNGGQGEAGGADLTGWNFWNPATDEWERIVKFTDATASLELPEQIGDERSATLDYFDIRTADSVVGAPHNLHCEALGSGVDLGETISAGVELNAEASEGAREGDMVQLSADLHPSDAEGTVVFESDGSTVALAAVGDGKATAEVSLAAGEHSISARFISSDRTLAPSMTSSLVTVTVEPPAECPEMLDDGNGAVVRLVYLSLLERCPDPGGYVYWTDRLDDGADREAFAKQLAYSTEALGLQVDQAYEQLLDRAPDASGRAYWVNRLSTKRSYTELQASLGGSSEAYRIAGSTNAGFVDYVYDRILHRSPDADGQAYWTARLDAGTNRGTMVKTFASLSEPLRVLSTDAYEAMLDRAPDADELAASVARLDATGDLAAEYAALIGSSAFYDRAQEFPNVND